MPHVGWNQFERVRPSAALDGIPDGAHAYFTHSFAVPVCDDTVAVTTHGQPFSAVVERAAVWGIQFHPEKSGDVGLAILRNFVARLGQTGADAGQTNHRVPRRPRRTVVKGIRFEQLRQAGDPAELARRYNARGSTSS